MKLREFSKGLALGIALGLVLIVTPAASAHHGCEGDCPPPPSPAPAIEKCVTKTELRIDNRDHAKDPKTQTVTVTAVNDNLDTNVGAHDVWAIVTYQANRFAAVEQQVGGTPVRLPDGGTVYSASFDVPVWRFTDGLVRAQIGDIHCDGLAESIAIA